MAASSMDGCWAKVHRANEQIDKLGPELDLFVQAHYHAYRIVPHFNSETGKYTVIAFDDGVPSPPFRLSVMIGEVIHHLRSSLDHLVWTLACARHSNPSDKIGFPICETSIQYERAFKNGMIKGLSGRAVAIIESVQPYRRDVPRRDHLFQLHQLNNTDKHRLLVTTCGIVANPLFDINPGSGDLQIVLPDASTVGLRRPTKDGAEIFSVTLKNFNAETKVDLKVSAQIAFEKFGDEGIVFVIPGLRQLRDATVQTLDLFQSEF